jgi:phenylacetate-coenzyme A ligase PaaK-like adenylate-forming protein
MAAFEELRRKHRKLASELLSRMRTHIEWPADRLAEYRTNALQELVKLCKARSRWHQGRLRQIDPDTVTEADLHRIPTMTKADLMENFDEIVTRPQLNLQRCEEHVESGETYLDDEFCVFVSGGVSGVRAVSIFGWEEAARTFVVGSRFMIRWAFQTNVFQASGTPTEASIGGGPGAHGTHHLSLIFGGGDRNSFAVTDPIDSIVESLNRVEPDILHVYPSVIPRLISESEEGRLRIKPVFVMAGAEPLLDAHQEMVRRVWGCPAFSSWGATEVGLLGSSSGFDPGLLLYDDHVIIEPVDVEGQPVGPGVRADKVLVTPLFHHVLPVIRYEITDQLTVLDEPASCGSTFTRTSLVDGRLDDYFIYDRNIEVHPHHFRTVLGRCKSIHEYQVQQTPTGASIKIVNNGQPDVEGLQTRIVESLQRCGLENPEIEITSTSAIERAGAAAKLRRFVPLGRSIQAAR